MTIHTPRVLELGGGVAAAYAAKLLGDHGADVVKAEAPGGDPTRTRGPFPLDAGADPEQSGTFHAFNLNKRGITLDLYSAQGSSQLASLLDWADILVHNLSPAESTRLKLTPTELANRYPSLVTVAITPFGMTGPYHNFEATELIMANAGGWTSLCPATHADETLPPLKAFGHQCELMTAVTGAMTALAAWRVARDGGGGEHIDLSTMAYVASVLEVAIPGWSYMHALPLRFHTRRLIPWGIFPAKDAPVFLICVEQDQWEQLIEFMGNPDWTSLELFHDPAGRAENPDLVHEFVGAFIREWNADELFHEAQKRRICLAPVMNLAAIDADPHVNSRTFFVDVEHPRTGKTRHLASATLTNSGRAPVRRAAPLLGQHNNEIAALFKDSTSKRPTSNPRAGNRPLPLAGIRVADLSWAWAGPFCTLNLAHLGAEVIRLESASRSDIYRRYMINPPEMEAGLNTSGVFNQWSQGKKSVAVNLRAPEGIEVVKSIVAQSDVVVQNFGTGVLDRLGLGYDTLKSIKPDIILASVSGFGQTGPYASYIGYGPSSAPLTGLCELTGYLGEGPDEIGLSMPDPTAGLTAAWEVVSALARRDATGKGDHLDVSLWEATAVLAAEGWMAHAFNGKQPDRQGNRDAFMAPHGCFACDGEQAWVAIACTDDAHWLRLANLINPAHAADPRFATLDGRKRHEDELEMIVGNWTRTQDRWAVTNTLQEQGIAAFPSFTAEDIVDDPHLNARGFIERLTHAVVGKRAHTGIPWLFSRRPNGVQAPAPCMGADTLRVLVDLLGTDPHRVAELIERKVLW